MGASRKQGTAAVESSLRGLGDRHRAALATLATLGLVLRGSIACRLTRCGHPRCRCHADPPLLHGPYYIWTRKVAGTTATVQLTPEDAARCKAWNRNMRLLDRTVRQLQALGLREPTLLRGR